MLVSQFIGKFKNFFHLTCKIHFLLGSRSLLSNGCQRLFPGGKAAGTWSLPLTSF